MKGFLYHYCSLETAIKYILPARQLRLGKLANTNDPRENRSFEFAKRYLIQKPPHITDDQFSKKLRESCKIICFSTSTNKYFGYEYLPMWAHYGGRHQGVCLEINQAEFIKENKSLITSRSIKKINYKKMEKERGKPAKTIDFRVFNDESYNDYIKWFQKKHQKDLFFTKNIDWSSEREVRALVYSNKKEDEFLSIQNSLSHIYLGVDFHDVYLPSLKGIANETKISKVNYVAGVRLVAEEIGL